MEVHRVRWNCRHESAVKAAPRALYPDFTTSRLLCCLFDEVDGGLEVERLEEGRNQADRLKKSRGHFNGGPKLLL